MARILDLLHRIPYPPNRGDEVRAHHLLRHLAARHEVLPGTFVDDAGDEPHGATVGRCCTKVEAVRPAGRLQAGFAARPSSVADATLQGA